MEAISLPKNELAEEVAPATPAALAASLQVSAALSQGASVQGWLMTLAYMPFGLVMAVWAAFPVATGTGVPIVDTFVGLAIAATGLGGSLGMGAMTLRQQQLARFWRNGAMELEEQLGTKADLFKREAALLSGEAIYVAGDRMRLSSVERPGKISAFHILYAMFTLVFAFLLIANLARFGRTL